MAKHRKKTSANRRLRRKRSKLYKRRQFVGAFGVRTAFVPGGRGGGPAILHEQVPLPQDRRQWLRDRDEDRFSEPEEMAVDFVRPRPKAIARVAREGVEEDVLSISSEESEIEVQAIEEELREIAGTWQEEPPKIKNGKNVGKKWEKRSNYLENPYFLPLFSHPSFLGVAGYCCVQFLVHWKQALLRPQSWYKDALQWFASAPY
eukprot:5360368-Amphidinium_carterae.1